ncbi:MAG TPA: HPr family phosphocarrier protein [Clostridiales bacterium]|nr:HPr family phosphocarrier protein [Clostridiales bacterium]
MKEVKAKVLAPEGLHARPAAVFVKTAQEFECEIEVRFGERSADAKSILSILSLGADHGACLVITADGVDEEQALEALTRVLTESTEGVLDSTREAGGSR